MERDYWITDGWTNFEKFVHDFTMQVIFKQGLEEFGK